MPRFKKQSGTHRIRLTKVHSKKELEARRLLNETLRTMEPRLAIAFGQASQLIINQPGLLRKLTAAIRLGDLTGAQDIVGMDNLAGALVGEGLNPDIATFQNEAIAAMRAGGVAGALQMGPETARLMGSLDLTNPAALTYLRDTLPTQIREISQESVEAVQAALLRGFEEGRPAVQIAREVRDSIGLTRTQGQAVSNFRKQLETGEMIGKLPSTRRLSATEQAQAGKFFRQAQAGKPASRAQIDTITARYHDSLLNRRAKNIARTEATRAFGEGQTALWDQAVAQGLLDPEKTRRKWLVTPDERLRECLPAKVPVLTMDGWRAISKVRRGDFVLTKGDRYKRVTDTFGKHYEGLMVTLELGGRSRVKVKATEGHPILTKNGWVPIENITLDTELRILAVPCATCGELIPRGPGRAQWCKNCGVARAVKAAASPESRAKAIESRQNGGGWKTGYKGSSHSNATKEKMRGHAIRRIEDGSMRDFRDTNIQRKAQLTQSAKNPLEKKLSTFLTGQCIEFEPQWPFEIEGKTRYADFYLPGPKIVVECDGFWHTVPGAEEKDAAMDTALKDRGVDVLRFDTKEINGSFQNVASAIRGRCCFLWMKPRKIIHAIVRRQSVHDIEVEGDHCFVAGGIVVHNSHAAVPPMNPDGVRLDEPFDTPIGPVMAPRTSGVASFDVNCRCVLVLDIDE